MEKFNFNPPNIFIDESSYPDPITTDESREQLSRPHHQMREFINELVDEVNREKSSDEISYKHDNLSAVTNVKQGLDEHYRLIKETQNHLNDSDENFNTHKNNSVIHVTSSEKSRWNNTYTKDETDAAISRKVVQIGAGDMAQHIYDKDGDGKVDHAELADEAKIADYAKKTSIAQTVSGDFITVETAKESAGALTIHGKTYQKTYSGKNLYDVNQISKPSGLTVDNDGWVSVNVDNTSGTSRLYFQANVPVSNLLKPNTEYTIVCDIASGSGFAYFYYVSTIPNSKSQFNATETAMNAGIHIAQAVTFDDFSDSVSMLRSVIAIDAGQKCSLKFRYSVIEGTNVTAENFVYEPFVGGKASPSPEFPQSVNGVVAGAKRIGKNLIDFSGLVDYSVNGITIKFVDSTIVINGTTTSVVDIIVVSDRHNSELFNHLLLGYEGQISLSNDIGLKCYFETDFNNSIIYDENKVTLSKNKLLRKAFIRVPSGSTYNNTVIKPIMCFGTDTTYEPYTESELYYNTGELFEGDSISAVGKLTRRFRKIVFDGTTDGKKMTNTSSNVRGFFAKFEDMKKGADNVVSSLVCSHFPTHSVQQIILNANYFGIANNSNCNLYICFESGNPLATGTLEQCNAWLKAQYDAGTPVTIVYELATSTEEEPTRNGDMILSKGINHIFSGEEFSPEFDLEYSPDGYPLFDWLYLKPEDIGAAPAVHNHDDRYFTENELNARLGTQCTFVLEGTTLTITTK